MKCPIFHLNKSIHQICIQYYNILSIRQLNSFSCIKYFSSVSENDPKKGKKSQKYKHTILFPSTSFPRNPVKKQRIKNEKNIINIANFGDLYAIQEKRDAAGYILHDGPPYANGKLHMGHALNKILKDAIVRHKYLKGHNVSFIPGWDCHGLPIELEALKQLPKMKGKASSSDQFDHLDPLEIRLKAQTVSASAIQTQRKTFDQWGLFVNWNNHYRTDDPSYIAKELRLFWILYEKGFIYQEYMPVHFSPSSRTSLAESELEYKEEHESPSLYLALRLISEDVKILGVGDDSVPIYLPIWTTTPWTLPSNVAVCANSQKDYALIRATVRGTEARLVWMCDRLEDVAMVLGSPAEVVTCFDGAALDRMTYAHPLNGCPCPVILSEHVSSDKGTGLVHTAPAHGREDFHIALQNQIPTNVQFVDDHGRMTAEVGDLLQGKLVPEEANQAVITILRNPKTYHASPVILNLDTVVHSYPYDWRTKKPTIMRASRQWFFDVNRIKEQAVKALDNVRLYPEKEKIQLVNRVRSRPYWCISRQRSWGVPIPAFFEPETGKSIVTKELVDHVISVLMCEGFDAWWHLPEAELLPPAFIQARIEAGQELPTKGKDILDIWFDSGSSWYCALDGRTSDLYLEGKDQMNGWFQSSLLTSVAMTGKAPYRTVFMHGFTVDEKGRKMSKSLRNVFDPELIVNGGKNPTPSPVYGSSILRWWAFRSTPTQDIKFGMGLMELCDFEVKAIRASFAFYLGTLHKFQGSDMIEVDKLRLDDQYALSRIHLFHDKVSNHFENFEFEKLPTTVYDFLVDEMGNEYMNSAKDLLYFEQEDDPRRKSILNTIYLFLPFLMESIWSLMPLLAEEVALFYREIQGKVNNSTKSSFTFGNLQLPTEWARFPHVWKFDEVLSVKRAFIEAVSVRSISRSDAINLKVQLKMSKKMEPILRTFQSSDCDHYSDLCRILGVSQVTIQLDDELIESFELEFSRADGTPCARCYKITDTSDELCARCERVLGNLIKKPP